MMYKKTTGEVRNVVAVMAAAVLLPSWATVQNLAGEWELSTSRFPHLTCPATMPGDIHTALLRSGAIEDPYYGSNELTVQWVGQLDWKLRREFTADAALLAAKSVILRLEDCDTFAKIKINGKTVGETSNRFRRWDFEVRKYLKPGVNEICGEFDSAQRRGDELRGRLDRRYPMANVPFALNQALIRKPACHAGWDWGPAIMSCGFCGKVELIVADMPRVEYVYTEQKFNDDLSHCTLTAYAEMSDGTRERKVFEIDQPPLWWPNGYGERKFYEFEIAGVKKRIGLRKLEVLNERTKSADGQDELSMTFRVNNRKVFCKGANWIPCDAIESRQTPARYRQLLESAAAANMNMLRVWGGGQYEKDCFYDLCDELGILLWHDMMCSCGVYPGTDWLLGEIREELRHQLRRLRDHASIALWCGDNECLGAINWWPETRAAAEFCRGEWLKRSKLQGELVAQYDPTRTYWPSSPCCGPGDFGDAWKNDAKGDMHNWRVWGANCPFDEFYRFRPRFCSEFGYQSFPSMEVAQTFASRGDILAHAPAFEWHQKSNRGNSRIRETMARYFPKPRDVEGELLLSQFQHAMAMKMACDGWRAQRPRCMGTLIWQLNDNWPVASWSMIEYGGKWKPLQHLARRFFAPISVVAQPTVVGDKVDVTKGRITVLNDTLETLKGEVVAEYWRYDGSLVKTERLPVEVAPDSVRDAGNFAAIDGTFLVMNFKGVQNDWHFGFYKDAQLAKAKIAVKVEGNRVTLTADKPAFFVWANLEGVKGEFDDNCLTLLPNRSQTIAFQGAFDPTKLKVRDLSSITE